MKLAHKLSMQLRAANWKPTSNSFETGRPAPNVGFKQSRKRSRRSSSLRDQRPAPNKRRSLTLAWLGGPPEAISGTSRQSPSWTRTRGGTTRGGGDVVVRQGMGLLHPYGRHRGCDGEADLTRRR